MVNEANTTHLVRNKLREMSYYDDNSNIIVEEQKSNSPKINKLLQHASKQGKGVGKPDFIIRHQDKQDYIIIIECKSSPLYHESKERNKYQNYAVDGALLYADYLKDDFNVISIGVSGENPKEMKIDFFLWLQNNLHYSHIQNLNSFISLIEIEKLIENKKHPISEDKLIKKAIEYNEELHNYKISETERCTFVSIILVALQDKLFLKTYKEYTNKNNKELLNHLYTACHRVLTENKLDDSKINIILSEYKKLQHKKILTDDKITKNQQQINNTMLQDFINKFKEDILPFVNEKKFDILGRFYTQFIKYAGKEASLGLVLTPPHITNFFCQIAELTEDSIVLDPCCGTGGFLIAAMNYMVDKIGNGNNSKKQEIKKKQLIGIEIKEDMFTHACSNMMMRGDGKSQIYHGDCFDQKLKNEVKTQKPNVTFLNPPYHKNKEDQLKFIENALELIDINGKGVAICQMSTVVGNKKEIVELRRRLLEKHTLEAVFSMPDQLFHPVGVVTCILVFTAYKPHKDSDKETFFGFFKDDGYVHGKNKGRIDQKNLWSGIQEKWLEAYKNHKNIPGLSVTHKVKPEDEWCAEAYMETNYNTLNDKDFIKKIKEFIAFNFVNEKYDEIN